MKIRRTRTRALTLRTFALAALAALASSHPTDSRAATNILPGPDQDRPGVIAPTSPSAALSPEGLTGGPRSVYRRETALGDFGGFRADLATNLGIAITPVYIGEVMGNPTGGIKQGITYDGLFNVPLDIDVDRLTRGLTSDVDFHVNALWLQGQGLSVRHTGDFSNTSNISGYNTVRLQELWLQKGFWNKRANLRLGLLAADAEFFTTSNGSLFLNGTFGAFTLVGANLPNPNIFPVAAPGVRFFVQPVTKFSFQAGIYGGDSGGTQDQNNHGTNFNLRSRDGAVIYSEVAYYLNQAPGDRGLTGTYKLGSFVHTGSQAFQTFDSQTRVSLGTGNSEDRSTNFGVYGIADQDLYKSGGKTISGFLRVGGAPENVNFVSFYVDGGVNFTGFVPNRLQDIAGVAVAHSSISDDYSRSDRAQGGTGFSSETVVEATYRVTIAPWFFVQPDLQYIFNPSGAHGSHDALVLGVRTSATF